jgi:WD repeat-containing protein 22
MELSNMASPVHFLKYRELNNRVPSWNGIVDARAESVSHFYRKNLYAHYGCVNAIEFSNDGTFLLSG